MRPPRFIRLLGAAAAMLLGVWPAVHAAVSIQGTRAVFLEREGEALVRLNNLGATPVLTQSWIDDGDGSADPASIRLPLALTPPVARINPGEGQVLRILQTGRGLPEDRESVLWLNVLEIPPLSQPSVELGANTLQFAFRTRIKLFYRPKALNEAPEKAHEKLSLALSDRSGTPALQARNRSAYHLTFRDLVLRTGNGAPVLARLGPTAERMLAPGQSLVLPLEQALPLPLQGAKAFYTLIDDHGGDRHGERTLDLESAPRP